jgi:uncharacterized protein YbbK (DUF523 family)
MKKILVSACLMGEPVRYHGGSKIVIHPAIDRWRAEGRLVAVCPEISAGLGAPRPSAEIANGGTGLSVLLGQETILDSTGSDVTDTYISGARIALAIAQSNDCRWALLTDGSPSCGTNLIYDGSFTGTKRSGSGVTAALLKMHGIHVFADYQIDILEACVSSAMSS